jgi:hypothetical protein
MLGPNHALRGHSSPRNSSFKEQSKRRSGSAALTCGIRPAGLARMVTVVSQGGGWAHNWPGTPVGKLAAIEGWLTVVAQIES